MFLQSIYNPTNTLRDTPLMTYINPTYLSADVLSTLHGISGRDLFRSQRIVADVCIYAPNVQKQLRTGNCGSLFWKF